MAANDTKKGGSFYLQSKVYRAKELLDDFQKEKRMEEKEQGSGKEQGRDSSTT
jgi:import inner membrane translocase subunit TIM16